MIRPDTSVKFATLRRYSARVVLSLVLFCAALSLGQSRPVTSSRLCLLAGTPTNYGDEAFPVTLYAVDSDKKLKVLREIVVQRDGLYSVRQATQVLFVAHPHVTPTTVSLIHTDDPSQLDEVVFNPRGLASVQNREGLAEPIPSRTNELFPLLNDPTRPNSGTIVALSDVRLAPDQRIVPDGWTEYAHFRTDGSPGGPNLPVGPFGFVVDRRVQISIFGHNVDVETVPPFIQKPGTGTIAWIMAVNADYSILSLAETSLSPVPSASGRTQAMFVHDRAKSKWGRIEVEGDRSRLRLFGDWLLTIVGMENPDHKASPGRESERNWGNVRLPNVQMEYENLIGRESWLPGVLTLQNLADGRKIRVETSQEDSEILRVDDSVVLYRINDSIYQAKIAGDQLRDTALVVKDDDVPEIHWAFWSK